MNYDKKYPSSVLCVIIILILISLKYLYNLINDGLLFDKVLIFGVWQVVVDDWVFCGFFIRLSNTIH